MSNQTLAADSCSSVAWSRPGLSSTRSRAAFVSDQAGKGIRIRIRVKKETFEKKVGLLERLVLPTLVLQHLYFKIHTRTVSKVSYRLAIISHRFFPFSFLFFSCSMSFILCNIHRYMTEFFRPIIHQWRHLCYKALRT